MKYDIIVIGSGPGGYVAAIRAAQLGKKVAVVERAEAGGVCLNWGCIPTKALLKSAQVYNYCKSAEHYGLNFAGEVRPNLEKIVARSRGVAETMNKGVLFLLKKNNVELINGFAKLKGNGRIDVDGTEYEADHIILATGARPREMPFMPIDGEHVISSKQALVLPKLPETMIVVGSGAIGSEFAWFYAALGVRVTIVEYMPRMMPLEDEEVSKTMERAFRKLRATVLTSTTVKAVKVNAEGLCEVEIEGKKGAETLTADVVLSAVGIKSNIEGIGLEELGVAVERDKVVVDEFYRTNVPGVYAIGDINGKMQLAHVATAQGTLVADHIAGKPCKQLNYNRIPSCVYCNPETAMVGLTEEQARATGKDVGTGVFNLSGNGKALTMGENHGFVKFVFDKATEEILGFHVIGPRATDLAAEVAAVMECEGTISEIGSTVHPHPTVSEAVMEAAHACHGNSVHAPKARK